MDITLLTIIIPTYNRGRSLELLLNSLTDEMIGMMHLVKVIIGNNCSTDETFMIIENFKAQVPTSIAFHHQRNLGADENFCYCVDQVSTRFFWMIGDDDLPKFGALRKIVQCLKENDPDLLYINSEWLPHIRCSNDGSAITDAPSVKLSRINFAKQVNVWITFISGIVVNYSRLHELNPKINIRKYSGTNLIQLGWVLPLLMSGSNFRIIEQRYILATSGNTGGYELLKVFATNFPKILDEVCGNDSEENKQIFNNLVWHYLPGLAWGVRFSGNTKFASEDRQESLKQIKGEIAFWLLILPITTLPKPIAIAFYAASKLLTILHKTRQNITH